MEELQSTDVLDKEILEDARKKAFKILKSADDSIRTSKESWDKKLERSLDKAKLRYSEKEKQLRREIMTRLPMDKRRMRSKTMDHFLKEAMENFLRSLDRASMLQIIEKELEKQIGGIAGGAGSLKGFGEVPLRYRQLSDEECRSIISPVFSGINFLYKEDTLRNIAGSFPALVVDFPCLRLTVSVDRAAEALLLDKRAELAGALLGEIEDG
jgi:vacuolar-type H+-ATPase subunit H